jgi:hypothetical protein
MVDEPIGISISPYGPEPEEPVGRRVSHPLLGAGWLIAAVLAVLASFTRLYGFSTPASGELADRIHISIDGWGRYRMTRTPADAGFNASSFPAGPRYGLLLCLAAAAMVVGWLIRRRALGQPRLVEFGLPLSGLASVFLGGVVGCMAVDSWPVIHGSGSTVRVGLCLYLAGGSAVLGIATWALERRGRPAADPPPAAATEEG